MIDKKVTNYSAQLKKLGIEHTFLEHPEMVEVADVYQYFHVNNTNGLSTLVMKADDQYVAVIRRDDCRLDYEKVKFLLGVKNLSIASDTEFETLTGHQHGAAHLLNPVKITLLDKKLFEKEYLMGGSGSLLVTIKYRSEDLKKIPGAKIVDVATVVRPQEIVSGKRLYSAITPSGDGTLHIGNYLGAVRQFIELAKQNECFFQIASLHALSTVQNKAQLEKNVETLVLGELALLGDAVKPGGNIHFCFQPDVFLHTELQSILNNVTPLGLIKRAHAYKDKLAKDVMEDDINLGLFSYPILMASDILIYKAHVVPVGKDQKQHVEITRDIAEKFNKTFHKNIFPLPDPYIPEEVASVLGTDGKRKMSKTLGNVISIFEPEEVIKKQVNSCFTDPTRIHATDPGHIEGNMVFAYLDFFGDKKKVDEYKEQYKKGNVSDVEIKEYLFESLMKTFAQARARYEELKNNPALITEILEHGTEVSRRVASQTMKEVREAVGLVNTYSIGSLKKSTITIDDFATVEMRVGKVTTAENVEKSEKLIRLHVDFSEFGLKTIFTGVRGYGYTPEDFIGKQFFFVFNLAPRKIMGEESQGMIMAVDSPSSGDSGEASGKPLFVSANGMPIGSKIR